MKQAQVGACVSAGYYPCVLWEVAAAQQALVSLAWGFGERTEPGLSSDLRNGNSGAG